MLATEVESPSVKALQQCHPELRQYLNFATLLPYLSKYGLITKEQQEELIEVPIYTTAQKADKLLSWLPRSRPDFLERFIQSLRESTEGTNHDELADSLEEALQEARNDTDGMVGYTPSNLVNGILYPPFSAHLHTHIHYRGSDIEGLCCE